MNSKNKKISGIKEISIKRFFGHISLLLDKGRLRIVKSALKKDELGTTGYNAIMRIKNDDIKIQALSLFGVEDYLKADIARTITDDNKKIEAIKLFKDEWAAADVITIMGDDNVKLKAIEYLVEEGAIEDVIHSIRAFDNIADIKGKAELLRVTKDKFGTDEILKNIELQIAEAEELKKIEDDTQKIEALKSLESECLKAELAATIKDDDKKLEVVKFLKNDWSKAVVAEKILDKNKKIETISLINDKKYKLKLATTINDDNIKVEVIEELDNEHTIAILARTITDDNIKLEIIASLKYDDVKREIAGTIKEDDNKIKIIDLFKDEKQKYYFIRTIKDDNKKIESIMKHCSYNDIEDFYWRNLESETSKSKNFKEIKKLLKKVKNSINTKDDNEKIENIKEINNESLKIKIAQTIKDDNKKIEALNFIKSIENKAKIIDSIKDRNKKLKSMEEFSPEEYKYFRNNSEDIDFIKDNIEIFIEKEGFKGEIPEGVIDELYEKNNSVVQNIDFRILNSKYIDILGKDKINLISCYTNIQEQILSLNDKQCYIFSKCIDNYMGKMNTDEWTVLADEMLKNISEGEFDELINNIPDIDKLSQKDFENLTQILQNSNWCSIKDISQVRNFEEIRIKKCNEIMQSETSTLQDKKGALIQKIFGHDYEYAKSIIQKFGEDIENINDGDSKDYVECLKLIESISDENTLKKIFEKCPFVQTDKVVVERNLKNEYGKMFNEGLYVPKQEDLVEGYSNVFEAGTDFKIIMTSVGAFHGMNAENYKEDWNRPIISTQHLCASYIRNDMIGTAPIRNICYGFSEMREDSLILSGNRDIYSSRSTFVSRAQNNENEKYYTPEKQINSTEKYNEMDFRRIQDGEKKQPDYILVFRKDGEIPNMEEAQKASKQWGEMPIVVVDIDKCLEAERQKVDQMMKEYSASPNPELAKEIKQKVRNNRVTSLRFCDDIRDEINNLEENNCSKEKTQEKNGKKESKIEVSEKDLEENYGQVSAIERKNEISRIRSVYKRIKEMKREEEHAK